MQAPQQPLTVVQWLLSYPKPFVNPSHNEKTLCEDYATNPGQCQKAELCNIYNPDLLLKALA